MNAEQRVSSIKKKVSVYLLEEKRQ